MINPSLIRFPVPPHAEVARNYREAGRDFLRRAWSEDSTNDVAEYAVMLAVILVLVFASSDR
jgi:hypothetical protein